MIVQINNNLIHLIQDALRVVQPSAKREGFATVPDVTWEDVGALESIREELSLAILVRLSVLSGGKGVTSGVVYSHMELWSYS